MAALSSVKQWLPIALCVFACAQAAAKGIPETDFEGKVKSVVMGEDKIVFVISGKIELVKLGAMQGAGTYDYTTTTSALDNVPVTYTRSPGTNYFWEPYSLVLRYAAGRTMKFSCYPDISYDHDKITAIDAKNMLIGTETGSMLSWVPAAIDGKVKSVAMEDHKIVIVVSGKIEFSVPDGNGRAPAADVADNVTITYKWLSQPDLEKAWKTNSAALRDAVGKTMRINFSRSDFTFSKDKVASVSTYELSIGDSKEAIPTPPPPALH